MAGGVDEPDRIVGGDSVEIGGGDVAVFGELALVPAGAGDPFSRFNESDLSLYTGDDFSYRNGIRELDAEEFFDASISDVGMGLTSNDPLETPPTARPVDPCISASGQSR